MFYWHVVFVFSKKFVLASASKIKEEKSLLCLVCFLPLEPVVAESGDAKLLTVRRNVL